MRHRYIPPLLDLLRKTCTDELSRRAAQQGLGSILAHHLVYRCVTRPDIKNPASPVRTPGNGIRKMSLVLQLMQRWNQSVWGKAERLVSVGVPEVAHADRTRPVRRYQGQRQHRLSQELMDQVVNDYLSGMSANACGRKYGIDTHTVLNNLTKRGFVTRTRTGPQLAGEALQQARDLRGQGWSYHAIGDEFGVSRMTARAALLRG